MVNSSIKRIFLFLKSKILPVALPILLILILIGGANAAVPPFFDGFENGINETTWNLSGSVSPYWNINSNSYNGSYSVNSTDIGDRQESVLKLNVDLNTISTLEFYWKVSSRWDDDYLYVCIDNDACTEDYGYFAIISGEINWTKVTYEDLGVGGHSIKFVYKKDSSSSGGNDTGWIDDIKIYATTTQEIDGDFGIERKTAFSGNEWGKFAISDNDILYYPFTTSENKGILRLNQINTLNFSKVIGNIDYYSNTNTYYYIYGTVVDDTNNFLYMVIDPSTYYSNGSNIHGGLILLKINLEELSDYSTLYYVNASVEPGYNWGGEWGWGGAIDGNYIYLPFKETNRGSDNYWTQQTGIKKINLSTFLVEDTLVIRNDWWYGAIYDTNRFENLIIDKNRNFMYWIDNTDYDEDDYIRKVDLTSFTLNRSINFGRNKPPSSLTLDENTGFLYVVSNAYANPLLYKINATGDNFGIDSTLRLSDTSLYSSVIDYPGGFLYVGTTRDSDYEKIIRVNISEGNFSEVKNITTASESNLFYASAKPDGKYVYFMSKNPYKILKVKISQATFDASGYVYFLDTDNTTNPLPGAFVYINDTLNATTDSSGYYSIPDVPNGVYTLYVSHPDFTPDNKTISNAAPNNDFILSFIRGSRFVQLADVHIGPDPLLCGWNNSESENCMSLLQTSIDRFDIVRDNIIANKPDFVLITGDLVEWNSAYQYSVFNTLISKFKENNISVYIVPGNHDRRGKDYSTWDYPIPNPFFPNNDLTNYKDYIGDGNNYDIRDNFFNQRGYQFIGLDSGHDPNFSIFNLPQLVLSPNGSGLSLDQINFISNNIIDGKTIIFMHHPAIDDTCLDNSCNVLTENKDLFVALARNKHVKLVLTGHTHRSKFFDSNGRINVNLRTNVTIPFEDINTFIRIIEPPFPAMSPLFIQTRSATKEDYTLPGYLVVNIDGASVLKERISLEDVRINGSNITPVTILYLNSPADLHVYDESGRHTGLNATGRIENSIPDSYYFEEYKFGNITLPAFARLYNTMLNYTYEIVSNFSRENIISDHATFNFTIKQNIRGAITTIKYNNVTINRNSKAYLQINTTQTNYTMQIDQDNDSIIDTTKQPDTIVTDYAPTAIILSPADGSTWEQGQTVTFNGSGIDNEDGTLSKLTWVSDRDDVIGHGNFTTANLSAGAHRIILLVNDSAGQVNTAKIVITVRDTLPPVLNIEYPPENKIFNKQNTTARGFAYDDSGILNVTVNNLQAGKENWNAILSLNEGWNVISVTATDNKGFSTIANRTVYYNSSLAGDTEPPAAITNLIHKTGYDDVNRAWINWTWDNPGDMDFSYVIIYLDNIRMENTSRSYYNISGLSGGANYTINIQSADVVDNINLTGVKDTARTSEKDPPTTNTPEAIIKFDTSSEDFRVYNSGTGAEVSFVELPSKLRRYTLTDSSGNTLSLVLKHKKTGKGAEINVISMQYNGGAVIGAAKNAASVEYSGKKGMLNELQQKIEVKKLFDARAKYSAKKGETEIRIKNEGQKELKQTRAGIVMLELLTDNGSLKLRY